MPFPFITRSHHEEVVALLKERLASLEQEHRKLLDHYAVLSHNRAIFEPAAKTPESAVDTPTIAPAEQDPHMRDIREAMKAGHRSPTAIANYISAKKQREYDAKAQQPTFAPVDDIVADFDKCVDEAAAKEQA